MFGIFQKLKNSDSPLIRGLGEWTEAILWAALIAFLIFRPFVIETYKIMSGSMLPELQIGEMLIVNRFVYGTRTPDAIGLPLTRRFDICRLPTFKLPAFQKPRLKDIVVFVSPNQDYKDYVKRLIGLPGTYLKFKGRVAYIKSKPEAPFQKLKEPYLKTAEGQTNDVVNNLQEVYIPQKGDQVNLNKLKARDFFYYKKAIYQENDLKKVEAVWHLYINGTEQPNYEIDLTITDFESANLISNYYLLNGFKETLIANKNLTPESDPLMLKGSDYIFDLKYGYPIFKNRQTSDAAYELKAIPFSQLKTEAFEWQSFERLIKLIQYKEKDKKVSYKLELQIDGKTITNYQLKNDCYFMVGDNRDNSSDSRAWGFVNDSYIKGKAWFRIYSPKFMRLPPSEINLDQIGRIWFLHQQ